MSTVAQNSHHGRDGVNDRTVVDEGFHIISLDWKGAVEPIFLLVCWLPMPSGEPLLQQCGGGIDMNDADPGKDLARFGNDTARDVGDDAAALVQRLHDVPGDAVGKAMGTPREGEGAAPPLRFEVVGRHRDVAGGHGPDG